MPRSLLISTLLLTALLGCQVEEGRFTHANLRVESDSLNVQLRGRSHGDSRHPCPRGLSGSARVNGIPMKEIDHGGGEYVPDSDREDCVGLWYVLDLKQLPADTTSLDITFDDTQRAGGWHLRADWPHTRIWTEDDLAARVRAHEEFEVRWEPADEPTPDLDLLAFDRGRWRSAGHVQGVLADSEPGSGSARFRLDGLGPDTLWNVTVQQRGELENTSCSGFAHCDFEGGGGQGLLHPVGIPPTRPDGVAPPRECIAAPGADSSSYRAPNVQQLPDLSTHRVSLNMSCDGADLSFVVLGACGVCGGGKSTYVVANRGTQAASFSVRSNTETVEGEELEPGQLSAPFEISFEGALSQIEILNDGDCDTTSNSQWVASVVCKSYTNPAAPLYEDCNNTCKL